MGGADLAVIKEKILREFDRKWSDPKERLKIIPGKDFLSDLNSWIQQKYNVTISIANIINSLPKNLVPPEMNTLIDKIDNFRKQPLNK